MPFWKCYYHIVWATKFRQSSITSLEQSVIYSTVDMLVHRFDCKLYAINTMSDHAHIAISIPPKVAISDWVGRVKGTLSHEINATIERNELFAWQASFGVLSFGEKRLPFVMDYVKNQQIHHANQETYPYMEEISE